MLAVVAPLYTQQELSRVGIRVSKRAYSSARQHSKQYGPGYVPPPQKRQRVHRQTSNAAISNVIAAAVDHSSSRAYGTVAVRTTAGVVEIPRLNSKFSSRQALVEAISQDLLNQGLKTMNEATIYRIVGALRLRCATNLGGLDTTTSELGKVNFSILSDLAASAYAVVGSVPDLLPEKDLHLLLLHVSEYLLYYYPLSIHQTTPNHAPCDILLCAQHAHGLGSCSGSHTHDSESPLRHFFRLQRQLTLLFSSAASLGGYAAEEVKMEWAVRKPMLTAFMAHQMRGSHQDEWAESVSKGLGENGALVVFD